MTKLFIKNIKLIGFGIAMLIIGYSIGFIQAYNLGERYGFDNGRDFCKHLIVKGVK